MAKIVDVSVSDQTKAVTQKGFKSVLLCDFANDVPFAKITESSKLTGDMKLLADKFFENGGTELNIFGSTTGSTVSEALAPMIGKDFYGVISTAKTSDKITELSTWVGSNKKLYNAELPADTAKEATDLAAAINSERVSIYAVKGSDMTGISGAVAGACFRKEAGSLTWTNQPVSGVAVSGYELADENSLVKGNVNVIAKILGVVCTFGANTTSGTKIDITRSKDWLEARCIEEVTRLLIAVDKIPFTNAGISQVGSALLSVGSQASRQGMASEYSIGALNVDDIPANDKANRVLKGLTFTVVLAGAIETISMNLIVTL